MSRKMKKKAKAEPRQTGKRASELEYLKHFFQSADFGPADSDVRQAIQDKFMRDTGKLPPEGYFCCDSCGEDKKEDCRCGGV